ncbi:YkgJ family cysteine cluster protein [Candidatus Woesearchaeota archaeon]|nr:YkgJ family cysteine cluster protein [Candidatus Woesearchaeota archaeon]
MVFQCTHCGICCRDPAIAINLTAGDLMRLSQRLGRPISRLFPEIVDFNPFPSNEFGIIAFEPGLNKPCALHLNMRCSIYADRPLNCRIFPFWLLKAPKAMWDPDYECLDSLAGVQGAERQQYLSYAKALAGLIMQESELTEELLARIGARKIVDLRNHPEFRALEQLPRREQERKVIALAAALRDNGFFTGAAERLERAILADAHLLDIIRTNTEQMREFEQIAYPHGNPPSN